MLLNFDLVKHRVYPYGFKEYLIAKLELNFSEKVILSSGDTAATYKLLDISLEYDAKFAERYATARGEFYAETTSIPYAQVILINYHTLSKKDTIWKIDVNHMSSFITRLTVIISWLTW